MTAECRPFVAHAGEVSSTNVEYRWREFEPRGLGSVGPSGEPLLVVLNQSTGQVLQYSELERVQWDPFDYRQSIVNRTR